MKFTSKVMIAGAKPLNQSIEGKEYNFTKVYVSTDIKDGAGFATVEYRWGDSSNFQKIKEMIFPFEAEVTMEILTNGKATSTVLLDIKLPTSK